MGISLQDMNYTISLERNLSNFPGLEKYKDDLQELKKISEFAQDKLMDCGTEEVEHAAGAKHNLVVGDGVQDISDALDDSLDFVKKLLADKELMEKEPFLKSYLGLYKTQLERAFSDKDNACDHYADDTINIATFLSDQFDNLPTGEKYKNMPEKQKETADKILNFMNSYSNYYDFTKQVDKAIMENPTGISDDKIAQVTGEKLSELQDATQKLADTPKEDVQQFFLDTENKFSLEKNVNFLYDDPKHNPSKAAEQLGARRDQMDKHLKPEEAALLESVAAQMKGIIGTAYGLGAKVDDLPDSHRGMVQEMKTLGETCKGMLKDGFESEEQKREFFKDLGNKASAFKLAYDSTEPPKEMTGKENLAMENITFCMRENVKFQTGALNQAEKMGKKFEDAELAKDPEFSKQIKQFYQMMKKTGDGYLFHKNSKQYTEMMNSIKVVAELSDKEPLNDTQLNALGEHYGKLSKVCQNYLTDRKIGKQKTEVGEDRFAGALGILNLVDPENGERVRQAAENKRGKEVSFEKISRQAAEKGNIQTNQQPPEAVNKAPEAEGPAEGGREKSVVEQTRDKVNGWFDKLKSVDYNMLGKGSEEFRNVMESMAELKKYTDERFKANSKGTIDLNTMLDYHEKEMDVINKMEAYLDHKEEQMEADPNRKNDPGKQKREQPRIKTTLGLLDEMQNSRVERENAVVNTMNKIARPKVEKLLSDEETKRQAQNISPENYMKSAYRSLEMLNNLDGKNWIKGENESLRSFCNKVQSYTDEKKYDKSKDFIMNDRNNPRRNILKDSYKRFKGAKDDPEKFPGGEKLSNAQLKDKLIESRGDVNPYVDGAKIKPYDLKGKKEAIKNETVRKQKLMVAQPKKQVQRSSAPTL
jgi:hypothetical protein